ncbi:lens fiber major intrinsic protein-like isoform X1 [Pieris brassicae]|uniref:lens fiber major intrinsic protein-like isoform X1 n=1 Tax=Pieris brassicae TaxID=7116 RepID=UPI001E65F3F3|nr:lens fiber major intrinsic protein-like isoform X1 [Pieris brassicae]
MESTLKEKGARAWAVMWWRALVAEVLATALLVGLGAAALLPPGAPLSHPALAFGFLVVALIEGFGGISGAHMNPAVTLAAALAGRLPWAAALPYVIAQVVGATLGFGALMLLSPSAFFESGPVGGTAPGSGVGVISAALLEALLTGTLVLTAGGIWRAEDAGRVDPAASLKLGLVVAGLIYAGGPLTGASLNPARSFAPALLQGFTADHWVYWVGPLGGAAAASLLQRTLGPPARRPVRPEDLPLHDKAEA